MLRNEVEAIQRACSVLDSSYRPLVTFVAVQKRHHARFFPTQREDADRSGNILPGTVIESGVTHPSGKLINLLSRWKSHAFLSLAKPERPSK